MVRLWRCEGVDDRDDGENRPRLAGDTAAHGIEKSKVLSPGFWGDEKAELKENSDSDRLRLRSIVLSGFRSPIGIMMSCFRLVL